MADRDVTIYFKNETGEPLSLKEQDLKHGKWKEEPPSQILSGSLGKMYAGKRDSSSVGTEGHVKYQVGNTRTVVKIEFKCPLQKATSGAMTIDTGNPADYCFGETNSDFNTWESFPKSKPVTAYFFIGKSSGPCPS